MKNLAKDKILIFGGTGFVGSVFCQNFSRKYDITIVGSNFNYSSTNNIINLIKKVHPKFIIYMSAISAIKKVDENLMDSFKISYDYLKNVLISSLSYNQKFKFLFVSSAQVYGFKNLSYNKTILPVNENFPLQPENTYAYLKIFSEEIVKKFCDNNDIFYSIARPFNHTGPTQNDDFLIPKICKFAAQQKEQILELKDISEYRDYTDVRDIVDAYEKILLYGRDKEIYNVCSGISYKADDIILLLNKLLNININYNFLKNDKLNYFVGDFTKISDHTSWKPKIKLEETLIAITEKYKIS